MERINIAVLDDNRTALRTVSGTLLDVFRDHDYDPNVESFQTVKGISDAAKEERFDLMLLDIDLQDGDGIRFAKKVLEQDRLIDIIFVSNREDRVFEALKVHPYGFIRKSKFFQDTAQVLESYIEDRKNRRTGREIFLDVQGQPVRVEVDDILYIEGSNKVREVFLSSRKEALTVNDSLENLEEALKKDGFLRVHKGYLVNCKYIRLIGKTDITLTTGTDIPVARRKLTEVKEAYFDYIEGGDSKLL